MTRPAQNFDDAQFLDIISSAEVAGMTALIHRLTLHLVSEKFKLSDLLQAITNCLYERGFNNQVVSHMESVVAEVVKAEGSEDE